MTRHCSAPTPPSWTVSSQTSVSLTMLTRLPMAVCWQPGWQSCGRSDWWTFLMRPSACVKACVEKPSAQMNSLLLHRVWQSRLHLCGCARPMKLTSFLTRFLSTRSSSLMRGQPRLPRTLVLFAAAHQLLSSVTLSLRPPHALKPAWVNLKTHCLPSPMRTPGTASLRWHSSAAFFLRAR